MRALKIFFPIAFLLSGSGGKLTWGIIIHSAIFALYYPMAIALFLLTLPIWIVLFMIPVLSVVFVVIFVALLFVLIVIGIIVPFYCAGGITIGILNYKKLLSVLENTAVEQEIALL